MSDHVDELIVAIKKAIVAAVDAKAEYLFANHAVRKTEEGKAFFAAEGKYGDARQRVDTAVAKLRQFFEEDALIHMGDDDD